jgi:hypothetical protein
MALENGSRWRMVVAGEVAGECAGEWCGSRWRMICAGEREEALETGSRWRMGGAGDYYSLALRFLWPLYFSGHYISLPLLFSSHYISPASTYLWPLLFL